MCYCPGAGESPRIHGCRGAKLIGLVSKLPGIAASQEICAAAFLITPKIFPFSLKSGFMLSCRAAAPRGSDTALPCSLSSPRGAWGHWESKIGRTLLGHCHGDMGSLCPAEAGQGPPARPSLPDMGLDKPNPSSPWHGCPRAATLPACASNRDGAGAGTTRVFCSRCPRAMARSRPFTSTPPALSLLSVFSTQKGGGCG